MLPLAVVGDWLELVALAGLMLPLGAVVLRFGERLLGRRVSLTPPERVLLALYASGGVLFVLASLPVAIYGEPLLAGLFVGGGVVYAAICYRERGSGLRSTLAFGGTAPVLLLAVLTAGVLAVEVVGVAPLTLPNMLDGSLHALFVNLLVTNHTLPWTLSPYAGMGVTYPQGAPVWMSIPVLLFGWPIVLAPLRLPPLFLALSIPAAYCVGDRFCRGLTGTSESWAALLFAAFFGLVASWPRLAIGGSFDFAFGFPLFLLLLGWTVTLVRVPRGGWGEWVAFGTVAGIEFSLSLVLGVTSMILFAGYIIAFRARSGPTLVRWAARWLTVTGIAVAFLARSLVGFVVWFPYPGHVLVPTGNPPLPPSQIAQSLSYAYVSGEVNPFVFLKPKLSPIPVLSVEVMVLLAAGLVLMVWSLVRPTARLRAYLPRTLVAPIAVGTVVLFTEVAAILLADAANLSAGGVSSVTDVEEVSVVLFVFYEFIAVLPLLGAVAFLWPTRAPPAGVHRSLPPPPSRSLGRATARGFPHLKATLVAAVLLVPLASGLGATAIVVPGYISGHIHQLANVSSDDLAALTWAGEHLPPCSRVLVAPGSVGQYLPEFVAVSVVYPVFPAPENLSYALVVQDLDSGTYTEETHEELLQLGITEVFVSGQNSVTYLPFQLAPLLSSPDFDPLEAVGDVTILEFVPGSSIADCSVG